ncbi:MAG: AbrB/MazE/SpoVT family DNA-binding domain-containing protein [Tildeniella nuda ZEHNDER 1965/U140]|nr:AbrB/MazE/SpoVT family DNA-binding domain-containing protein [Tildeniella nuda ZEHNDER 1965/U140]
METIKLTTDGNSQVVVLPEQFHLAGSEVYVKKMGNAIVLLSKDDPWRSLFESLEQFSDDFMDASDRLPLQSREELFE